MKPANCLILFVVSLLLLIANFNSLAQQNPILDNFSVYENDGKVILVWTIKSGSTCNGIQIYRSTDSTNFSQVGSIAGICGSSSSPTPYNFTDDSPVKNSFNYYRLDFGGSGSSEILSLEIIDISKDGFQIRPNPVSTDARIYFDNNKKIEHQLTLFNMGGVSIFTTTTNKDFFLLHSTLLQSGIYLFTISARESAVNIHGKIIVLHK